MAQNNSTHFVVDEWKTYLTPLCEAGVSENDARILLDGYLHIQFAPAYGARTKFRGQVNVPDDVKAECERVIAQKYRTS